MNKRIKLLALILSLVMVLGAMVAMPLTTSAKGNHTDFDLRYVDDFIRAYDTAGNYKDIVDSYARVDYVPYVNGSTFTFDGVIDETEYTVKNPVKTHSYASDKAPSHDNLAPSKTLATPIDLYEYFAQDATYLYMGFELPYYSAHCMVQLQIGRSASNSYGIGGDSNSNQFGMYNFKRVNLTVDTAGAYTVTASNASAPSWTASEVIKFTAPAEGETTAYVEFKINKAELKAAVGAADTNSFNYALGYGAIREGAKSLNYISNALLNDAVNHKANSGASTDTGSYYGRQICRNIGLVDYSAYEDFNVKTDLEAYGYKNYIVNDAFKSPSIDGAASAEEGYTLVENTLAEDTKNNKTGLDIVEYYAHNKDYIYYAFTMPYNGDGTTAPSVYIRLLPYDTTTPESNYYNSQQIVLNAATATTASTIKIDGTRNYFPGYATSKANFAAEDIEFAGVLGATTATYELKISRAKMAAIAGIDSIDSFAYYVTVDNRQIAYDLSLESTLLNGLKETRLFNATVIGKNVSLKTLGVADLVDIVEGFGFETADAEYNANANIDVTDGTIDASKYSVSRVDTCGYRNGNATGAAAVTEYFAHDDEWVYLAFNAVGESSAMDVYYYIWLKDSPCGMDFGTVDALTFRFNISGGTVTFAGISDLTKTSTKAYTTTPSDVFGEDDYDGRGTWTYGNNRHVVCELKISKAAMMAAAGYESVDEFEYFGTAVRYWLTGQNDHSTDGAWSNIQWSFNPDLFKSLPGTTASWLARATKLSYTTLAEVETADLGSVRFGSTETSGLRFKTTVSNIYLADLEAQGYTVTAGTLIAPQDYIGTGEGTKFAELAFDTDGLVIGETCLNVVADLEQAYVNGTTTTTFTGSIVNIKNQNLDRDFSARGYLALTKGGVTTYVYGDVVTHNIKDVAQRAIDSGKYSGTQLELLEKMAAGPIVEA